VILRIEGWLVWLAAAVGIAVSVVAAFLIRGMFRAPSDITIPDTAGPEVLPPEREAISRASERLTAAEEELRVIVGGPLTPDARSHAISDALRRSAPLLLCVLLLAGCGHAPPVFSMAIPEMPPPALVDLPPPEPDACPAAEAMIPGEPAPYVADGLAVCRAQVVPEAQVLDLIQQQHLAEYYEAQASICRDYRTADRAIAEDVAARRWEERQALRRQVLAHQVALPVAVTLAIIAGIVVGRGVP